MPVIFYESMGDFHKSLPPGNYTPQRDYRAAQVKKRDRWSGNQTYAEARDNLFLGDPQALRESEKILEKLEGDGLELAQAQWDNDRTGFIPCVPSFLAGSPDSMRRLTEFQSETTPIKIFNDVCLSAHFSSQELTKRGTAILALARKLQVIRPVELYLYASMYGKDSKDGHGACAIPVIRLDTNPLDLTTASYAMANAGFLRQICFSWGDERGFEGSWAWNGYPGSNRPNLIKALKATETDLVIDGAYATDKLMNNPLEWVNDQVKKYAAVISDQ